MSERPSQLRQNLHEEAAFLALADALTPLIALIQHGKVAYVNPAGCKLLGRARDQFVGRDYFEFVLAVDPASIEQRDHARASGAGQPRRFVECVRRPDGREVWIDYTVDELRLDDRAWTLVTGHDMTEQKHVEAALRESDDRFRRAFQNATIGKVITSPDLRFLQVNRAFCEMLGYTEKEILAKTPVEMTHPDDLEDSRAAAMRLVRGEQSSTRFPKRYFHKDGHIVWVDLTTSLVRGREGKPAYFVSEILDVTERKRSDELLRDREAKLAEAQRVAHIGSWEYDVATDRSTWSAELYRIFGVDPASFTPSKRTTFARYHDADRQRVIDTVEAAIRDGTSFEFEARFVLDSGEVRLLHSIGRAECDASGAPARLYGVAQDITERKRAEEAIRESEARYHALVEYAPEAIAVMDVTTATFIDVNSAAERLFGYSREQILGNSPLRFCPHTQPDGTPSAVAVKQHIEQVLAGETPTYVFLANHSTGREILIEVRSARLPAKGRELIRSSITDITELKALQERVRHDDRMAAIGVLAAGVAHEVGNPLLALSMAVQSLERRLIDEYAQKKLGLISEHIDRISKIVRQMSDLARPRQSKKLDSDVNRVVGRSLEIIRYDKRAKEVKIRFDPAADLPFVFAIEDQLMQVCLNLGLNALDAVATNPPTRPKAIVIRSARTERDGRRFVRVSFADTGSGIPESVRPRVFQPFFTTKALGTGTGLGLSVSRRIIEEHEGTLDFECGEVDGTTFFFELPVAGASQPRISKAHE